MSPQKSDDGRARLDQLLVEQGLFASRSRARDAILRGTVVVDGSSIKRPGMQIGRSARIAVADPAQRYVSRAALKLAAALDHFGFDPAGLDCLDLGASTGGFSQVLLERGATRIAAVDVGHGQMHELLRNDPRVDVIEGVNARNLSRGHLGGLTPQFIVCDVSFISLRLVLGPALELAAAGSRGVFLVKPQFEAGRDAIGKGGLVRDPEIGPRIAQELSTWLDHQPGWETMGTCPAHIEGGDGNREFLLAGAKQ